MLFFLDISVDSKDLSLDQLWDAWEAETDAAVGAIEAGLVKALHKVAGDRRVVAIVDVPDHATLDRMLMAGLPMADHLVINELTPVRPYEEFAADVKARWQD
jgi:muconolactone delta-isomerase